MAATIIDWSPRLPSGPIPRGRYYVGDPVGLIMWHQKEKGVYKAPLRALSDPSGREFWGLLQLPDHRRPFSRLSQYRPKTVPNHDTNFQMGANGTPPPPPRSVLHWLFKFVCANFSLLSSVTKCSDRAICSLNAHSTRWERWEVALVCVQTPGDCRSLPISSCC